MKNIVSAGMFGCLAIVLVLAGGVAAEEYPPEMDAWLQAAKLGPYEESPQNWAEIEKLAKEEGEVVIYSASSRIAKVAPEFEKKYPGIKVTSFDLGSVKTIEKTVGEQEAGLYNADIITTGGSGQVIHELLGKHRIVNFVPDMVADNIPQDLQDPLLVRINEAIVFLYNTEVYDAPPIKNLWELTTPEWKGRAVIKNPLESLSNFMGICTIVQHADEMAEAYKKFTGEEIVLSDGVPDAGYEFIYRLLHNDLVILKSGSKVAAASGKKGQEAPPIGITSYTYLRYNDSKEYVNAIITGFEPVDSLIYPTYTAVARQAPHPNAAKLFTAFLMGDPEITLDSVIEPPYTEGKSAELLQGLAPYYEPGSMSPRDDVPLPKGGELWNELSSWTVDPDFMWYEGPKVQDFWIQESSM
ncbi:iron ABC transporter substrate-binding protein [candidate division KSB3 bacterium]|uniref:Iron ABC transporter substrate-binding protein n=1 Tax=candidate division KSB3 bacterium TaxID=2044937 RepID=A0A2G6ECL7_9BACT|nr:MAG: iron ABC transporter substrate-binding protein [candidate division KSB3 bacterium]